MAKGRMLLKQISCSKRQSFLKSDTARLIYTWMLAHLDRNGNFWGDPQLVRSYVIPYLDVTVKDVESFLADLKEHSLIDFYEIEGKRYITYPDFVLKQTRIDPNEKPRFPLPNGIASAPAHPHTEKKQGNPEVSVLRKYFYTKFADKRGDEYTADYGRDGKIAIRLLGSMALNEIYELIDIYFNIKDDWFEKKGYDFQTFSSSINAIKQKKRIAAKAPAIKNL